MKKIKQIKTYEIKDLAVKNHHNNINYNFEDTEEGENNKYENTEKLNRNYVHNMKRNFSFEEQNESPNGNTRISNERQNEAKIIVNNDIENNHSTRLNKFSQSNEDHFGSTLFKTNKNVNLKKDYSKEIPIRINYKENEPEKYRHIHDEILDSIKKEKRERNNNKEFYNNYSLPHKSLNNLDLNQNENFYSFNDNSQPVMFSSKYSKKDFLNRSYKSAEPTKKFKLNASELDLDHYHCNHHCEFLLLRNYIKSGQKVSDFILKNRNKIKLFGNKNYKNRDPLEYLEDVQSHPEVPLILSHNLFRCSNFDSSCYNNLAKLQPNHEVKVKEYKDFIKKDNQIVGTVTHKMIEDTLNPVELTPIPSKSRKIIKSNIEKNEFLEAERNAVVRRRVEYTHNLYSKKIYVTNEVKRFEVQDLKKKLSKREDKNKIKVNEYMLAEFDAMKELKKVINTKEKKNLKLPKEGKKIISESVEDLVNEYHKELIKNRKANNIKKNKHEIKQKNTNDYVKNEQNIKNSQDYDVNGMKMQDELMEVEDNYYYAYIQRVILIQRAYRKHFLIKNFSAEFIQKNVKGYLIRKKLNRYLSALRILKLQFKNLQKIVNKNTKRVFLFNLSTHKGIPYIFKLILFLQRRIKLFLKHKRLQRLKRKKEEKILRYSEEYYMCKNVANGKVFNKVIKYSFKNRIDSIKPHFGFMINLKYKFLKNSFNLFKKRMEKVIKKIEIIKNDFSDKAYFKTIKNNFSDKLEHSCKLIVNALRLNKKLNEKRKQDLIAEYDNKTKSKSKSLRKNKIKGENPCIIRKSTRINLNIDNIRLIQNEYRRHYTTKKVKQQEILKKSMIKICNSNSINVVADKKNKSQDVFLINSSSVEIKKSRANKANLEITNSLVNINKSYEKSIEKEVTLNIKKVNPFTITKSIIFRNNVSIEKKSSLITNCLKTNYNNKKASKVIKYEEPEFKNARNKHMSNGNVITKKSKIDIFNNIVLIKDGLRKMVNNKKSEIKHISNEKVFKISKYQDYKISKVIKIGNYSIDKTACLIQNSLKNSLKSKNKKVFTKPDLNFPSVFFKIILNQYENKCVKSVSDSLKKNLNKNKLIKQNESFIIPVKPIKINNIWDSKSLFTKIIKINKNKKIDLINSSIRKYKISKNKNESIKNIDDEEIQEIIGESEMVELDNCKTKINKLQNSNIKIMKLAKNTNNYICRKSHIMDKNCLVIYSNIIKNSLKYIAYLKQKFNVLERIKLFYVLKNHFNKLKIIKIPKESILSNQTIEIVSQQNLELKKVKKINLSAINSLKRVVSNLSCKNSFNLWKINAYKLKSLNKIFLDLNNRENKLSLNKSFDRWEKMTKNERLLKQIDNHMTQVNKGHLFKKLELKLNQIINKRIAMIKVINNAEKIRNTNDLKHGFDKYKFFMKLTDKEKSIILLNSILNSNSLRKKFIVYKLKIKHLISKEKGMNKLKDIISKNAVIKVKQALMKNSFFKNQISNRGEFKNVRKFIFLGNRRNYHK